MVVIITAVTIILYIILIGFTWHNLDMLENKMKIACIIAGLIVMLISTLIVFNISTSGVEYQNVSMVGSIRNMIIAVFTPVNGLVLMPYLASMLSKIKSNDITQEKFKIRAIILAVIFIIVLIIECSYFKNIQLGILNIISKM